MSQPGRRKSSTGSGDSSSNLPSRGVGRSPSVEQSIGRIMEESVQRGFDESAVDEDVESLSRTTSNSTQQLGQHSMTGAHRRPSYIATAPHPFLGLQQEMTVPTEHEREVAISEERTLLRDNNLLPPKQARRESQASGTSGQGLLKPGISSPGSSAWQRKKEVTDEESAIGGGTADHEEPSETTALLAGAPGGSSAASPGDPDDSEDIDRKWEDAVLAGQIKTTWQREGKVLAGYSLPLMLTFILQNSLTLTSVFTVGHIGKSELGAVSVGAMTANITGYAVFHGLATSLDTLCAQAYGSGKKTLVGLHLQRMVFFLWAATIPIAILWLSATQILHVIVPEKEIAVYAGQYLKILVLGAPGYALFESSKRYVQAQGRFGATLYVLLIAAPLNVFMQWLFVWHLKWGFIGCPIAIVITENLMPLLLFLYVRFVGGMECWPGFSRQAFRNWWPMIRLAIPGLIMVMAEFLAFEILVLASARISATHLAANTILQSLTVMTYQLPFPLSIAASTRVANLIGAALPDAAKKTAKVTFVIGAIVGVLNMVVLSVFRGYIPYLFTNDHEVAKLAADTLPVNAAFQLFDALAAQCNGVLRGLGKQEFGGYASLVAYYAIAIPISFGTGFGLHWNLYGFWAGPAAALLMVSVVEGIYIYRTSWEKASEEAAQRNAAG